MKKDKKYVLHEWVAPDAFPFILPTLELYLTGVISLKEAYSKLDSSATKYGYMELPLYERFNLAYYLEKDKFPTEMITIKHSMEQGKVYNGELCLISQPHGFNTVVLIGNEYKLRYVNKNMFPDTVDDKSSIYIEMLKDELSLLTKKLGKLKSSCNSFTEAAVYQQQAKLRAQQMIVRKVLRKIKKQKP